MDTILIQCISVAYKLAVYNTQCVNTANVGISKIFVNYRDRGGPRLHEQKNPAVVFNNP